MNKVDIFAFNGDPICLAHTLLNATDMREKRYDVKPVIEGTATEQIKELSEPGKPFSSLYAKATENGLVNCVCRACSGKMETPEDAEAQKLPVCDEMAGHPSTARYMEDGFQIITF